MQTVIFIPARYESIRYPGKPLADITGADGTSKTLIERTWRAAKSVSGTQDVYVLTDDQRIADEVNRFGGKVLMTSTSLRNGTERCAEALVQLATRPDVVVNIQGDALLTPPDYVEALMAEMQDCDVAMATPVLKADAPQLDHLKTDRKEGRIGATTAVFDGNHDALYFSKEILPFRDDSAVFHHIGCYAYRCDALEAYAALAPTALEKSESLEQLRFLENGIAVRCVEVDPRGRAFWELNNPGDVEIIEDIMRDEGLT